MKKCPYCAEEIQDAAIVCRFCGRSLTPPMPGTTTQTSGEKSQMSGGSLAVLAGGLLVVVGSFLPWATIRAAFLGTVNKSGLEGGDGIITLIAGIIIVLVGVARLNGGIELPRLLQRSPVILGIIAGVVAVLDYVNVSDTVSGISSDYAAGSVGVGIYVVGIGAVIAIVGGLQLREPGTKPGTKHLAAPKLKGLTILRDGNLHTLGRFSQKTETGPTTKLCIWDKRVPGPPVSQFPDTDEGRRQADDEFNRLEATASITPPPA